MQKVCIVGLGYIGLPLAGILADSGYQVLGVDIREDIIAKINNGEACSKEPGLKTLVQAAINAGNLKVSSTKPSKSDIFIIAAQTPLTKTKTADLKYVARATESILPILEKGNTVILESTVPPRTLTDVIAPILGKTGLGVGGDIYLAYSPERVLPGAILKELIQNDRIIGGMNEKSAQKAKALYESFVQGRIYLTDATTAELAKLAENIFRDVNIALANELAMVCSNLRLNVWEVVELANRHPRVNLHSPGPGVGGHCLSVNAYFLIQKGLNENGLIAQARAINERMPGVVVKELEEILKGIDSPTVTLFGVAYKGDVDDTRGSPALEIIEGLEEREIKTRAYDPHVDVFAYKLYTLKEAVNDSDCILITADHKEFREVDIEYIAPLMRHKIIFDTKNCIDSRKWMEYNFKTYVLGDKRR